MQLLTTPHTPFPFFRAMHSRAKQTGSSLLEVMVAVLIVSFGILGLVGLQAKATSLSVDAEDRTRAGLLANEVVSAVQLERSISLPNSKLTFLNEKVADQAKGGLPDGKLTIKQGSASNVALVTIDWKPVSTSSDKDVDRARHTTLAIIP